MTATILVGDMRDVLATLEPESVHACVTDPPYELGFMGNAWDRTGIAFAESAWAEVYRVLKPGGFLLAFSATRTYHRMAVAIEDAGFEIKDQIMWIFGQGMPKGLNVSKAIDKQHGVWRGKAGAVVSANGSMSGPNYERTEMEPPATDAAREWDGWNSAIKPACEPVCVARKPFRGTIVNNVLTHGTGAYNVDACRIEGVMDGTWGATQKSSIGYGGTTPTDYQTQQHPSGRWPANVILDEAAAAVLDAMSGERKAGKPRDDRGKGGIWSPSVDGIPAGPQYGDVGGASRFFYTAKASQAERNIGHAPGERNTHATVKPIDLMQWLVRLVTPTGGIVLDPFMGSGSTGVACSREGFAFIGIDLDAHNVATARKRIVGDAPLFASVADRATARPAPDLPALDAGDARSGERLGALHDARGSE